MKVLNIVETAYRATVEEQDDTILWLSHNLKKAGADVSVLLRANAVNYAVEGQDASGLSFGAKKQTNPVDIVRDIKDMVAAGIPVLLVAEDASQRGLPDDRLINGVEKIPAGDLPQLFDRFDHVWHW